MPQHVAELTQPCPLERSLLLPIIDRPADLPIVAHGVGCLDPSPEILRETLQDLTLPGLMLRSRQDYALLLEVNFFPRDTK